jgi:signal transduction histidine kinase
MKPYFVFILLLIGSISKGQHILEINDSFSSKGFECFSFTDSTNKRTVSEILNSNFKVIHSEDINFGTTNYNHWIKVDIINTGTKTNSVILDCDIVYLDEFSYYVFANNKLIDKKENISWRTPINNKLLKSRYFPTVLKLNPNGKQTIFIKIYSRQGHIYCPINAYSLFEYQKEYLEFDLLFFNVISILLIVLIISILGLFFYQDKRILYYIIYLFGHIIYSLNLEGFLAHYAPEFLKEQKWYALGSILSGIGGILFANSYIFEEGTKRWLILRKISFGIVFYLIICLIIFFFFPMENRMVKLNIFNSFLFYISIIIALEAVFRKQLRAIIYLVSVIPVHFMSLTLIFKLINFEIVNRIGNFNLYLLTYFAPVFEFVLLGLALVIKLNTDSKRLQMRLNFSKKELILTQENERKKIAQDLHDDLGATLSALKGSISKRNFSLETKTLLNRAITDLRSISRNLLPADFEAFGLITSLEKYISSLNEQNKVKITFISFGSRVQLKHDIELNIYRIITELANNIMKHSEAKIATIQLIYHPSHLFVSVEDDGKGIAISDNNLGIGLKNVISRIEYLQATVLELGNGSSCSFVFKIPYEPHKS